MISRRLRQSPSQPAVPEIRPTLRRVAGKLIADAVKIVSGPDLVRRDFAIEQRLQLLPDSHSLFVIWFSHEPIQRGVFVRAVPPSRVGRIEEIGRAHV